MSGVGIVSDTHGLLREGVIELLRESELIIHAGDIGNPQILRQLSDLAPVVAIRGNVDREAWASELPKTAVAEMPGGLAYVLHDVNELDLNPAAAGFSVVISGHSHQPSLKTQRGVTYLNPGSAGPRRFRLPVTLARMEKTGPNWHVQFFDVLTGSVIEI